MTGSLVDTLAPPMMEASGRLACSRARWSSSFCIRKPHAVCLTNLAMPAGNSESEVSSPPKVQWSQLIVEGLLKHVISRSAA